MNSVKLIKLVKHHEELYNISHNKYCDMEWKESVWKKIGQELKSTGSECKTKWFNLRDQYRRSVKKQKLRNHPDDSLRKKWKHEEEISFLLPFFQERKSLNKPNVDLNEEDSKERENDDEEILKDEKNGEQKDESMELQDCLKAEEEKRKLEAIDIFFQSIAATVKTFTPYRQNIAKSRIFAIISEMEIEEIVKNEPQCQSSLLKTILL